MKKINNMENFPFDIKRMDLRPYFGITSDEWPDEEEQYFTQYCCVNKYIEDVFDDLYNKFKDKWEW